MIQPALLLLIVVLLVIDIVVTSRAQRTAREAIERIKANAEAQLRAMEKRPDADPR